MATRLARVCVGLVVALASVGVASEARATPTTPEPPVVILAPPPPALGLPPSDTPSRRERAEAHLEDGGFEVSLGTLFFRPSMKGLHFDGSGRPLSSWMNGNPRETFHHTGRELALDSPLMWGGELSAHYMRRYFAVGVLGFIAGHPGAADSEPVPRATLAVTQVNQGALFGYGGALDLAGAVPLGIVAFRPGTVLGLRGFSMPLTGYEQTTCPSRSGRVSCYEQARTEPQLFVEARMRLVITPPRSGFAFGAYVGMELVGGSTPTAGLFIGGTLTPHEDLRP